MYKEITKSEIGFTDLISLTFKFLVKNIPSLLAFSFLVLLPSAVYLGVNYFLTSNLAMGTSNTRSYPLAILLFNLTLNILTVFVNIAITGSATKFVYERIIGNEITVQSALKFGFQKIVPLSLTSFLFGVFIYGLTFLFVIPGIIFAIMWCFYIYAIIVENRSGIEALKFSRKVVAFRWWKTFGYTIGIGLIWVVISSVLLIIVNLISPIYNGTARESYRVLASNSFVENIAVIPFLYIGYTLIYAFFIVSTTMLYISWKNNMRKNEELAEKNKE